ncbi:MAG: EI24 domain-containing protein [Bdellovibrionales bacterium]|nr:EI24 domain-containing protein [Bdellovibrionales bacterium]
MTLPFRALGLLFRDFRLLVLAFFPGAFTFVASGALTWWVWSLWLNPLSWWLEIPSSLAVFFLSWLLLGNIALVPVEDAIVDRVQVLELGSVRYAPPGFSLARLGREFLFSLGVAVVGVLVLILGWIPGVGAVTFLFAALLTSYSFLTTPYARVAATAGERLRAFGRDVPSNLLLGLLLNVLLFVPLVNVFLLGYALILSTLVFLRRRQGKDPP